MPTEQDYINFFKAADADGSGELTPDELQGILNKKGYRKSKSEIKRMFDTVDTSGDGKISMSEYLAAMNAQPPKDHKEAAMRACFQGFDKNGDGSIDRSEMAAVWKEMGRHLSKEELDRLMQLTDKDGSGAVDYEEFISAVFGK